MNLDNVGKVVEVCARLHNFVINEQNEDGDSLQIDRFEHRGVPGSLGYMPSDLDDEETGELDEENEEMMGPLYSIAGLSNLRQGIRNLIENENLGRPQRNLERRQREQVEESP